MSMRDAPIEIVSYDAAWPLLFHAEADLLRSVLAPWLAGPIEHIGSTAVTGLAAKPIVDIMAAVRTLDDSRPAIAAVEPLGYCYAPYQVDREHWFCKPSPAFRTHHLHLVPIGSEHWARLLVFRNYLREHHDVAAEYEALKRNLADRHRFDRDVYTTAKASFIERVTNLASGPG